MTFGANLRMTTWMARRTMGLGSTRAAAFVHQRLSSSLSRWRTMISQPSLQRAVHVQAGLSPTAEEEGSALPSLHAAPVPSPTSQQHHHQHHGFVEVIFGPMFAGKTTELLKRVEAQQRRGMSVAVVKSNKDDRYDLTHIVTHDGLKRPCYSVPSLAAFKQVAGQDYHSFQVIAIDEAQFFSDLIDFCSTAADEDAKHVIVAGLDGDFQRRRFGQILDVVPFADSVTKLTAKCTYCMQEASAAAKAAAAAVGPGANGAANGVAAAAGQNGRVPLRVANGHVTGLPNGHGAGGLNGKHTQHRLPQHQHEQHAVQQPWPALFSLRIAADSRQEVVGGADKYAPVCRHHYLRLTQVRSSNDDGQAA